MSDDLSGFSMMDLFRMEADERLSVLTQGLVALEGSGTTASTIEPLMRAAHSLKGAARVVGLDPAVRVAHALEDCLVAAQKGQLTLQAGHVDILLLGVDLIEQISRVSEGEIAIWQSTHGEEVEAVIASLAAVETGNATATIPSVATPQAAPHSDQGTHQPAPTELPESLVQAPLTSTINADATRELRHLDEDSGNF